MARPLIFATFLLSTILHCQVSSQAAEYLFVVGGNGEGTGIFDDTLKATEIVSLTEGESIPECLKELADHPNENLNTAGGALPSAGRTKAFGLKLPMALKGDIKSRL